MDVLEPYQQDRIRATRKKIAADLDSAKSNDAMDLSLDDVEILAKFSTNMHPTLVNVAYSYSAYVRVGWHFANEIEETRETIVRVNVISGLAMALG